jgi:predicted aspartyl protease
VVDTGFTGHLTLPRATVEDFGLPIIGSAESILADGSLVMEDV